MLEPKIMNVYYGTDLLPYKDKERSVHYPITSGSVFTGASNSTEIRFYVDQIGDLDLTWVANAKLPNGKTGSKVLTGGTDENGTYVSLFLESWFTQVIGDLYIGLQGYNGGINYEYDSDTGLYSIHGTPTIQATGVLKVHIAYSTPYNGESDVLETDIQDFLAFATAIMTKQITVVSDISTEDISSYATGHLFFNVVNNQIYEKTDTSPYYKVHETYIPICNYEIGTSRTLEELFLILWQYGMFELNVGRGIIKFEREYYYVAGINRASSQELNYFNVNIIRLDGYYIFRSPYITGDTTLQNFLSSSSSNTNRYEIATKDMFNDYVTLATTQTISGNKTFSGIVTTTNDVYAEENVYFNNRVFFDQIDNSGKHGLYVYNDENDTVFNVDYEVISGLITKTAKVATYYYYENMENELYIGNDTGDTDVFVSGKLDALKFDTVELEIGTYNFTYNPESNYVRNLVFYAIEDVGGVATKTEWIIFTHYPTAVGNYDEIEIGTPSGNETIVSVNGEVNADRLEANTAKVATIQHPTTTSNTIAVNSPITVQTPTTDSNPATKKYVDDSITDVMEVAEGKCTTYVLSYADTIAIVKQQTYPSRPNMKFYVWNSTSKQWEDKTTELHNGDYDNVNIYNSGFNSQNNIGYTQRYLIFRSIGGEERYSTSPGNFYMYFLDPAINDLFKTGDIFLVIETDVPDRWYGGGKTPYFFYKLETSKVDLTSYVTTNTTQTISGAKTFNGITTFNNTVIFQNNHLVYSYESSGYTISLPQASGTLVVSSQLLASDSDIADILGD